MKYRGPICQKTANWPQKCGAQFAAKSVRGPICLGPICRGPIGLEPSAASAHQQHQHQMLVRYWIYSANNWGIYVNQKVSVRPSGAELQNVFFSLFNSWSPICRGPICQGPIYWGPICQGTKKCGPNLPSNRRRAQLALNHQQHQCINSMSALAVSEASTA